MTLPISLMKGGDGIYTCSISLISWTLLFSSEVQASVFSDVFARVDSGFIHFQSVIHDPDARIVAISTLYKEINAAEQLLLSLRNALTPISLLPPEVLARVFYFLSLEQRPCTRKQNLGWIRVTHVCRLWRQVALGDSSLWARISGKLTNPKWISEMLARARNTPLDITINLGGASSSSSPEKLLTMFTPHLFHTRVLRLHFQSKLHSASFQDICNQEAPTLEHFDLDSHYFLITFRELGGKKLFKGHAPRLRTFSLFQVFIPWSLIPRGQLTRLDVSFINEVSTDAPPNGDLNQLIDLLVNCPELEVLVLRCSLPSRLSQFPHGRTIHLPRLSHLDFVGSSSRVMNLFKMLKLPSSVALYLQCISENTSTHNDHFLLPVISAHFQSDAPVEFRSLSVTLGPGHSLEMTASTSLPTSRVRQSQHDEFLLCFAGVPDHGDWTDLIERVCKMLPISNLEFLSVFAPGIVDPVNWVDLFKRCTKVTTMQAIGRGTSSIVRSLATSKPANTKRRWKGRKNGNNNKDSTSAQPARNTAPRARAHVFPELTFLSLKRLDFAENEHPPGILFDVVQKGLRQRKATSYRTPLKMLRIDDCAISTRRAKALQRLVQKFHWDEKESFLDEPEEFAHHCADSDEPAWWEEFFDGTTEGE